MYAFANKSEKALEWFNKACTLARVEDNDFRLDCLYGIAFNLEGVSRFESYNGSLSLPYKTAKEYYQAFVKCAQPDAEKLPRAFYSLAVCAIHDAHLLAASQVGKKINLDKARRLYAQGEEAEKNMLFVFKSTVSETYPKKSSVKSMLDMVERMKSGQRSSSPSVVGGDKSITKKVRRKQVPNSQKNIKKIK